MEAVTKVPDVIEDKDVQIYQPGPMEMAQSFLSGGGDIESLKEMMALQKEHDAYQAKKAYTKAMAAFKANPPTIIKDKKVGFKSKKPGAGSTNYSHATLGNVAKQIGKAMGTHGLSASWPLNQTEKGITVTCTITHELGHSESTSLFAGSDNTGNKNSIQAIGSTISYLQRYTILALTGLATEDQDDDGMASSYINQDQIKNITKILKETGSDKKVFLEYLGVESIAKIPAQSYGKVLTSLKLKEKKNAVDPNRQKPNLLPPKDEL